MKLWAKLSLCIVLSGDALAQHREPTLQQIIEKFVFGGYIEGYGDKAMRRGGDSTSVALTKVLSSHVLNRDKIEDALYVLDMAFSNPSLIDNPPDRDPRTALFVLRYLDLSSQDPAVKAKIEETRRHVTAQTTGKN
ncbi:MAG: hypothetical protein WA324_22245 [Bryobacteraceae bacterium]